MPKPCKGCSRASSSRCSSNPNLSPTGDHTWRTSIPPPPPTATRKNPKPRLRPHPVQPRRGHTRFRRPRHPHSRGAVRQARPHRQLTLNATRKTPHMEDASENLTVEVPVTETGPDAPAATASPKRYAGEFDTVEELEAKYQELLKTTTTAAPSGNCRATAREVIRTATAIPKAVPRPTRRRNPPPPAATTRKRNSPARASTSANSSRSSTPRAASPRKATQSSNRRGSARPWWTATSPGARPCSKASSAT